MEPIIEFARVCAKDPHADSAQDKSKLQVDARIGKDC